nr:MAG TPA: hypothetical protein [Bacteriophage sp.]
MYRWRRVCKWCMATVERGFRNGTRFRRTQ